MILIIKPYFLVRFFCIFELNNKTMEAEKLRIGNLFQEQNTKEVIMVTELSQFKIGFSGSFKGEWQAKPIPLTEEWLLKLGGYESHGELRFNYYCRRNEIIKSISFDFLDSERFYFINDNGVTVGDRIDYVHQLQNLYFALTGEELSIK